MTFFLFFSSLAETTFKVFRVPKTEATYIITPALSITKLKKMKNDCFLPGRAEKVRFLQTFITPHLLSIVGVQRLSSELVPHLKY